MYCSCDNKGGTFLKNCGAALVGVLQDNLVLSTELTINNYSPKWRWLAVDIYRAAERRGKYPTLATDTEVNSCFSIY